MLPSLAAWCYRRRRLVVVSWIVVLLGINVLAQSAGGDLLKTFSLIVCSKLSVVSEIVAMGRSNGVYPRLIPD